MKQINQIDIVIRLYEIDNYVIVEATHNPTGLSARSNKKNSICFKRKIAENRLRYLIKEFYKNGYYSTSIS